MKLDAARLDAYLTVREGVLPVFQAFEAKGKEIEAQHKTPGQRPNVTGLFEAAGFRLLEARRDLAGRDRVLVFERE